MSRGGQQACVPRTLLSIQLPLRGTHDIHSASAYMCFDIWILCTMHMYMYIIYVHVHTVQVMRNLYICECRVRVILLASLYV